MPRPKKLSRGDKVCGWIECLKITIGEDAGKNFKLRPWQRRFIKDVYDPIHPKGNRVVRRAVLSVARKNGKTELAAALILVHLIGPEAELNGEIYSAANDREQASIVFNAVIRMIEKSPYLSAKLKVVPSTKTIYVRESGIKGEGSKFRALSADAGTKHGLNPSFVVYDELAQTKNRELFDTLTTSQGARAEPLFLTISTQNNEPSHVLSEMIDDGMRVDETTGAKCDPSIVVHLYAADDECDLLDEEQWFRANPALGDFRDINEFRVMAQRAKRLPSEENSFRLLYLNQRVSLQASLIAQSDWKASTAKKPIVFAAHHNDPQTGKVVYGERVWLALDMSRRVDLTALVMINADGEKTKVACWFWKPSDYLEEHTRRDRIPYDVFARVPEDGEPKLLASPGRSIAPKGVVTKVAELCSQYEVMGLVYDRWGMDELLRHFDEIGLAAQEGDGYGLRLMPWGQGFKDMSPAVTAFEDAVVNGNLEHPNHPILNWNVSNAQVTSDGADGRKLDKEKSRTRIDGAVALAMALGAKSRERETVVINPWADPNYKFAPIQVR